MDSQSSIKKDDKNVDSILFNLCKLNVNKFPRKQNARNK